jgi:serine/threonine protein kinase
MCAVFADLADGVAAFHQEGQAHGDIKPANILRVGSTWKLADFGIAAPLDGSYSLVGGTTLDYCPPEELTGAVDAPADSTGAAQGGRRLHRSADVWALGIALFEAVTKRHPYVGDSARGRLASIMSDRRDFTGISPELATLLDQHCLAIDHHNRMAPEELAIRLRSIATSTPDAATPATPAATPIPPIASPAATPLLAEAPASTSPPPMKPVLSDSASLAESSKVASKVGRRAWAAIAATIVAIAGLIGYLSTRSSDEPTLPETLATLSSLSTDTGIELSTDTNAPNATAETTTETLAGTTTETAAKETAAADTSVTSSRPANASPTEALTELPPLP